MNAVNEVFVEVSVVLGDAVMPISHLLRMGRGAVIDLSTALDETVSVFANNRLVARGEIVIAGENIAVSITEVLHEGLAQSDQTAPAAQAG